MTRAHERQSDPLPADWDDDLRELDELLRIDAARREQDAPAGLVDRIFAASSSELAAEPVPVRTRSLRFPQWRVASQYIAAAAVIVLLVTVAAVLSTRVTAPGDGPLATGAPISAGDEAWLVVETANSPLDDRIEETALVVLELCVADPWETMSIWNDLESDLLLDVKGW